MYQKLHHLVQYLHHQSEFTLLTCYRFGFMMIILGAVFAVLSFPTLQLLQNPVHFAKLDYLFINTLELNEATSKQDSASNGAISGASTGASLCQGIPIIGIPLGILLGGYIGHQLDDNF